MARLANLQGKKVGIDTVIFIYLLEGHSEFGSCSRELFRLIEHGTIKGIACDLVLAELMVKPLRQNRWEIAEQYTTELLQFSNLNFCTVTREVVFAAAKLRGIYNIQLVDAIHLATSQLNGCDAFITNDHALQISEPELEIVMLKDLC